MRKKLNRLLHSVIVIVLEIRSHLSLTLTANDMTACCFKSGTKHPAIYIICLGIRTSQECEQKVEVLP